MKSKLVHRIGFTLVEIMIVVAIIGLLASIAIPNFIHSRQTAQMNTCISNLRCIDGAKQQWAFEQRKQDTDTPMGTDLQPYLGRTAAGELPACPVDGAQCFSTSYAPQSIGSRPACLIVSATHVLP
jgi:prepilin-type N-terminal cleavage/methylation domain-containing protein